MEVSGNRNQPKLLTLVCIVKHTVFHMYVTITRLPLISVYLPCKLKWNENCDSSETECHLAQIRDLAVNVCPGLSNEYNIVTVYSDDAQNYVN